MKPISSISSHSHPTAIRHPILDNASIRIIKAEAYTSVQLSFRSNSYGSVTDNIADMEELKKKNVLIVGAGVAGLSTSYYLAKAGASSCSSANISS